MTEKEEAWVNEIMRVLMRRPHAPVGTMFDLSDAKAEAEIRRDERARLAAQLEGECPGEEFSQQHLSLWLRGRVSL